MGFRKIRRVQAQSNDLQIQQALDRMRAEINIVPLQTVTVAPQGGDFTRIYDAVESITDASVSKPYGIIVMPGVTIEPPITMKSFVSIDCLVPGAAIAIAADPNSPLFTMAENSGIKGLTAIGPLNHSSFYASGGTDNTSVENCNVNAALVAYHATGAGTVLLVEESKALNSTVGTCLFSEDSARIGSANMLSYAQNGFVSHTGGVM